MASFGRRRGPRRCVFRDGTARNACWVRSGKRPRSWAGFVRERPPRSEGVGRLEWSCRIVKIGAGRERSFRIIVRRRGPVLGFEGRRVYGRACPRNPWRSAKFQRTKDRCQMKKEQESGFMAESTFLPRLPVFLRHLSFRTLQCSSLSEAIRLVSPGKSMPDDRCLMADVRKTWENRRIRLFLSVISHQKSAILFPDSPQPLPSWPTASSSVGSGSSGRFNSLIRR